MTARQQLTKTAYSGKYPAAAVTLTETAEDATNHTAIAITDKTVVTIHNTHATTTFTYTVTSIADALHGRTGDITAQNITAGQIKVIGPLGLDGWLQTDGNLYVSASDVSVKFGAYETQ
jgi:hypothetical protein